MVPSGALKPHWLSGRRPCWLLSEVRYIHIDERHNLRISFLYKTEKELKKERKTERERERKKDGKIAQKTKRNKERQTKRQKKESGGRQVADSWKNE